MPDANVQKVWVRIGGIDQGMLLDVRGRDRPVLLFVHGGPGVPEHWLNASHPSALHEAYTVAWWEQRGAGLSYRSGIPPHTMTVDRFVEDTLEVARHLKAHFGVPRVTLMGHSWGSFLGVLACARAPELFDAYVGMGQITHQAASEKEAYEEMLAAFRARGEQRWVRRLEAVPVTGEVPLPRGYEALRDAAMHTLGLGTTRDMRSVITGIFLPTLASKDYTLREKIAFWRGKVFSQRFGLWNELLRTDLRTLVPRLAVPAYFLHGVHDRTVSYRLARAYAAKLEAPRVGFYSFPRSAHSPAFEEPARALKILREDVLGGATALADPKPS